MSGRPKGTRRRSALDSQRADQLNRLGWSGRQIGELFQDERAALREALREALRDESEKRAKRGEPPIKTLGLAIKKLEDPTRAVSQHLDEGRTLREATPKEFQSRLGG